jgi:hypothetical protein
MLVTTEQMFMPIGQTTKKEKIIKNKEYKKDSRIKDKISLWCSKYMWFYF